MDRELTKMQANNLDRYLIKAEDTIEGFMNKPPNCSSIDLPQLNGWLEYSIMDNVLWIHTAFSDVPHKKTLSVWKALKNHAIESGCIKIRFITSRNPKAWERLFKVKPVEWKMEFDLTKE